MYMRLRATLDWIRSFLFQPVTYVLFLSALDLTEVQKPEKGTELHPSVIYHCTHIQEH